jgi:hypothetical protein
VSTGVKTPDTSPFDFLFEEKVLDLSGRKFTFRELSVAENDACIDAAREKDGTINGRINMRMAIAKSSVEPKITVDDLAKLPNRVYLRFAEFVNDINSYDDALKAEEEEGESEGNG